MQSIKTNTWNELAQKKWHPIKRENVSVSAVEEALQRLSYITGRFNQVSVRISIS